MRDRLASQRGADPVGDRSHMKFVSSIHYYLRLVRLGRSGTEVLYLLYREDQLTRGLRLRCLLLWHLAVTFARRGLTVELSGAHAGV
jgi:hypothetical protein